MSPPRANFSILIPTHNRAESLGRLIRSLEALELSESMAAEVIVVDNGCTDGTAAMVSKEALGARRLPLKLIAESRKGKASALNRGLAFGQGEIIVIVDDDVVADPKLLLSHWQCYEETDFDAVQGRVLPGVDPEGKAADPGRLREYNIPLIDYGAEYRGIRGLTGTNLSFKRRVFEQVGYFEPRLGPGASGFSEDTEYSIRIRRAGFKIGYTPRAVVYHELSPARYGREYNRRVEYRKGVSRSIYRRDSIAFRVLPNLFANCARYAFYRLAGNSQKAYKTEGRIMKGWGYLMGKLKARRRDAVAAGQ